jgi:DUF1680 family protein
MGETPTPRKGKMLSRREFVAAAAVVVASGMVKGAQEPTTYAFSQGIEGPREKLIPLGYDQVTLTAGPLKAQQDRIFAFYRGIDLDRMFKAIRQIQNMPAPGKDMGGWYDVGGFAPGHGIGQFMSGLSRFTKNTGSAEGRDKVQQMVKAFSETLAVEKSSLEGHRFPAYLFDKMVIGLVDAHRYADDPAALDVLAKWVEKSQKYLPEKALSREEMRERNKKDMSFAWDESYTLPEHLFIAGEISGEKKYTEMAGRYLHDRPFFDPLAAGKNVLPGLHAYSHFNCLSSGAKAYLSLGDEKYLRAVTNAWEIIGTTQRFASGGWGPNEAFVEPGKGLLGESLKNSRNHFETPCGGRAEFKLARYLLCATGDAKYADPMERVLYNGILGVKDPKEDGSAFYYSDYQDNAKKRFHPDKWPCCSASLPQVVADYSVSLYMRDDRGINVCLYAPSTVKWEQGGKGGTTVEMTCSTKYPAEGAVEFAMKLTQPVKFALRLRVPGWVKSKCTAKLNGEDVAMVMEPNGFAVIDRDWKNGDRLQWIMPIDWREERVDPQHENIVALMRGPVMMVAVSEGVKAPANVNDKLLLESVGAQMVRIKPYALVGDEAYTTYLSKS